MLSKYICIIYLHIHSVQIELISLVNKCTDYVYSIYVKCIVLVIKIFHHY